MAKDFLTVDPIEWGLDADVNLDDYRVKREILLSDTPPEPEYEIADVINPEDLGKGKIKYHEVALEREDGTTSHYEVVVPKRRKQEPKDIVRGTVMFMLAPVYERLFRLRGVYQNSLINDAIVMYTHLRWKACVEGTEEVWADLAYLQKGCGMGRDRTKRARKLLREMKVIECRVDRPRDAEGKYVNTEKKRTFISIKGMAGLSDALSRLATVVNPPSLNTSPDGHPSTGTEDSNQESEKNTDIYREPRIIDFNTARASVG